MASFYTRWLNDTRDSQLENGGIPNTSVIAKIAAFPGFNEDALKYSAFADTIKSELSKKFINQETIFR